MHELASQLMGGYHAATGPQNTDAQTGQTRYDFSPKSLNPKGAWKYEAPTTMPGEKGKAGRWVYMQAPPGSGFGHHVDSAHGYQGFSEPKGKTVEQGDPWTNTFRATGGDTPLGFLFRDVAYNQPSGEYNVPKKRITDIPDYED